MSNTQLARKLRKGQTDAERHFWNAVRDRQISGWKFRRQVPTGPYIVDFCCPDKKLIVELDGGQHATRTQEDAARTKFLEQAGYKVIRFWDNDVLTNLPGVLEALTLTLSQRERE